MSQPSEQQLIEAVTDEILDGVRKAGQYDALAERARTQLAAIPEEQRGGPLTPELVDAAIRASVLASTAGVLHAIGRLGLVVARVADPSDMH